MAMAPKLSLLGRTVVDSRVCNVLVLCVGVKHAVLA